MNYFCSYEPELHPGVTYKLKSPKATLKIFATGSVTVTGKIIFASLFDKISCNLLERSIHLLSKIPMNSKCDVLKTVGGITYSISNS